MTKHLLYLASGNAVRFGENKLLRSFEGKPLYLHGLEALIRAAKSDPECDLTVISRYPEIRDAVHAMGICAVDAPESPMGMSWSIKAGIRAVGPCAPEDFLMFVCADQPHLQADSVRRLLLRARPGTMVARLCWDHTDGNPVLFSARLIPQLRQLTGDRGGKSIIGAYPCIRVQAGDPRELLDIDTEEDMKLQLGIRE